jgi:uncharacterized protein (UPF0303 family)
MGLSEDMERVALQERALQLPHLDARLAWELGVRLRTMAVERELHVVIDVRRFGQPLFYAALESTKPDNVEWVRRKSNVVARFHSSSYAVGLEHFSHRCTPYPECRNQAWALSGVICGSRSVMA